jgi:hypothetical protein
MKSEALKVMQVSIAVSVASTELGIGDSFLSRIHDLFKVTQYRISAVYSHFRFLLGVTNVPCSAYF